MTKRNTSWLRDFAEIGVLFLVTAVLYCLKCNIGGWYTEVPFTIFLGVSAVFIAAVALFVGFYCFHAGMKWLVGFIYKYRDILENVFCVLIFGAAASSTFYVIGLHVLDIGGTIEGLKRFFNPVGEFITALVIVAVMFGSVVYLLVLLVLDDLSEKDKKKKKPSKKGGKSK